MVQQHVHEATQLHQTINRLARKREICTVYEEAQWVGKNQWLHQLETKGDDYLKDNELYLVGIVDMSPKVMAKTSGRKASLTEEMGMDE